MKYFTSDDMTFSYHCSLSIFLVVTTFFNTHMQKTFMSRNQTHHIDPSWSSLEECGSFEDFTAFYINIDNADPMLLYLDQTPAKYLHLSCIFTTCHGACGLSNSLSHSSPYFAPHKTILILCDKHISVNFSGYCCLIW